MAKKEAFISVGSRNVIYSNGDRYYGEVRLYSKDAERLFNFDNTDMISVGNDESKQMFLPAASCRFDSGQQPVHGNAVNCDVVVPAAEAVDG